MSVDLLLLTHAAATLFMMGLIWTVQVVHYPLFAMVGRDGFARYERAHQRRISWLVGPAMTIEALSAAAICASPRTDLVRTEAWVAIGLLAAIWLSTALVQAPLHSRLARAPEPRLIRLLVLSNWVRTLAWTGRAPLALAMLTNGSGGAAGVAG